MTCCPELRRRRRRGLPELAEPELVRHFTALSQRNFAIDIGFYPLGSCTMKYNPRINERAAALPGFRWLHPLQRPERAQGMLQLMWELGEMLAEVAGLCRHHAAAGGGRARRADGPADRPRVPHGAREDGTRRKVLIPDSAHGTNPATVTIAGYEVVRLGQNADGGVDLDDLRAKADASTAA